MLKLNSVFSNGMIFQRDTQNNVYGIADAGEKTELRLIQGGKEIFRGEGEAGADGHFRISIPPCPGSTEPYEIKVSCGNESTEIHDVYSGELFNISGQSNMELPVSRTRYPFSEPAVLKENPLIREFRVPIVSCFTPGEVSYDFPEGGAWKNAVGDNIADMSAAGYYFATDIFERLGIPVGLVNTSAGGAAVEGFMPYDMIREYGIDDEFLDEATKPGYIERRTEFDTTALQNWFDSLGTEDFGLVGSDDMKECVVPCTTDDIGELNGFSGRLFFFREFTVPESFPLDGAELIMGTVTDSDTMYINGVKVGETTYKYPPRYYPVGSGILRKGKNTIAVRVEITNGIGGFNKDKKYCLKNGCREIALSGKWKYAVAKRAERLEPGVFFQSKPLALYSTMFAPAVMLKYKALLWYQGESNVWAADHYKQMFTDFIKFYRRSIGYDIPVIFTQLCSFKGMAGENEISDGWARLRNAQLGCLETEKTAMAVIFDIGEYNDLHPKNKYGVGKRLAYYAGGVVYGDEVVFVRCRNAEQKDDTIVLTFDGEVFLKNADESQFEAVFEDGTTEKLIPAANETCGDTVLLKCGHSGKIKAVRYAWDNAPEILNLYDLMLVPISTFEITL